MMVRDMRTVITLSSRWRVQSHQVRPIHRDSFTQRKATAVREGTGVGLNDVYRNTRLSAAVFSTCWLPLTPKSSLEHFLVKHKLSRTRVFHRVGRYVSEFGLCASGVCTRTVNAPVT